MTLAYKTIAKLPLLSHCSVILETSLLWNHPLQEFMTCIQVALPNALLNTHFHSCFCMDPFYSPKLLQKPLHPFPWLLSRATLRKGAKVLEVPLGTCWCDGWVQNHSAKMIYSCFLAFLPCVALHSSIRRECQGSVAVCYKVPRSCKMKADLQPAHSLFLAPLFALCSVINFFLWERPAIHLWVLLLQRPCPCTALGGSLL